MYEAFYGLREQPFAPTPDPAFLYVGRHIERALQQLEHGFAHDAAFVLISGEAGSGKTTLVNHLVKELGAQATVGVVAAATLDRATMMQGVALAFGLEAHGRGDLALFHAFIEFAAKEFAAGRRVVLIVDDAQALGWARLDELRLLSTVNDDAGLALRTVLVGESELRNMMRRPQLQQLAERIGAKYHIGRLAAYETLEYVRHRMRVAGTPRTNIFRSSALHLVHTSSRGIPRLVNQLCNAALVYGFAAQQRRIGTDLMLEVIRECCADWVVPGQIGPSPALRATSPTEVGEVENPEPSPGLRPTSPAEVGEVEEEVTPAREPS